MIITQPRTTSTKGMSLGMILSSDILATAQAAKRLTPKGGVIMPMARFTTMMVPKCTGSTPNFMATGTRMGASTMMEADVSMNMPMMNRAMLTPNKNKTGLVRCSARNFPIMSGTQARVSMKLNSPALAMMNIITADEITDFFSTIINLG